MGVDWISLFEPVSDLIRDFRGAHEQGRVKGINGRERQSKPILFRAFGNGFQLIKAPCKVSVSLPC